MLTRQAKRRIERAARKHIAAIDADLIARLKAEKRGWMYSPGAVYTYSQPERAERRASVSKYAG